MAILQIVVCALTFTCLIGSSLCVIVEKPKLISALRDFAKTGVKGGTFEEAVGPIKFPHTFRSNYEPTENSSVYCDVCDAMVDTILTARRDGKDKETIAPFIIAVCDSMNIESLEVCSAFVAANLDTVLYIVDNTPKLTSNHFCSVVLQNYGCESDTPVEWSVKIPQMKEAEVNEDYEEDDDEQNRLDDDLHILHISDIHYDPNYAVDSLAACDGPLCCQAELGNPKNPNDAAGRWGDYRNCDTPWRVIESLIEQFGKYDAAVYVTGNIINHKVWGTDRLKHFTDYATVLLALQKKFKRIYPVLGSFEPYPLDDFGENPNSKLTTKWAKEWTRFISGSNETEETVRKGGYYTSTMKINMESVKDLEIIVLNTNACNPYNFWLIQNEVDPFDQLAWLVKVLKNLEDNNDHAHILMHMPSGGCLKNWSREFRRIVDRFSKVISAIFNGNSHKDAFNIYYKKKKISEIATVAFNGGSLSPYSGGNPNIRIYSSLDDGYEIYDADTWIYNLTEANLTPDQHPVWFKEYKFTYVFSNILDVNSGTKLLKAFATNSTMLDSYFKYYHKQGDVHLSRGCDSKCKLKLLCEIVNVEFGDTAKCQEITDIFNSQ